jgi:cysteinyl-tRNA synthetase
MSIWTNLTSIFGLKAPQNLRARGRRRSRLERKPLDFVPEFPQFETAEAQLAVARLEGVETWAYKLQNNTVDLVAGCLADVFVMDPHSDGMQTVFQSADVERMRQRATGAPMKLLAYMSIGEAEENRFYWNPKWIRKSGGKRTPTAQAPKWLIAQNGEGWVDNYKVRYWDPDWQKLIIGEGMFLDRIAAAGFDGVYLDIIDGFEYFEENHLAGHKAARAEMIAFVRRIAARGRASKPGFLVVPQNGEQLLEYANYRAAISAIGKEDILFNQKEGVDINERAVAVRQPADAIRYTTDDLRLALGDGIPVLSVEYLQDDPGNRRLIPATELEMRGLGYVPYFADRHLKALHPICPPRSNGPVV